VSARLPVRLAIGERAAVGGTDILAVTTADRAADDHPDTDADPDPHADPDPNADPDTARAHSDAADPGAVASGRSGPEGAWRRWRLGPLRSLA
jgi:hypothetical protein